AASRVSFENIDEEDYLLIKSPLSGVVTSVTYNQVGDKVPSDQPIAGIAPEGAKPQLKIRIPEQSRALLREGLEVKLKFNAFPYQRYGYIPGRLDYIAPATNQSQEDKTPAYEGRVSLEKSFFEVDGRQHDLRYGMSAQAEIVVRQRRLIDVALDSLRGVSG
ncbi:MAG TPA: HlyD family efflux transporter periplasmic adaptor subunit, partial [Blastocatellia bacterium]|nr:HlyD family efflux transporter periplasmic adaptor subunit [Blastocatellia bacterium]